MERLGDCLGSATEGARSHQGIAMNFKEIAARSITDDVIDQARLSSALEERALAIINQSIELHKRSIELRLQAEEILKEIRFGL
jgi:hypothetical protein